MRAIDRAGIADICFMSQEILSIVIPAFNEEKYIYNVLCRVQSVVLLNDIGREIVVVDDCSRDNTKGQVDLFTSNFPQVRLQYIRHEKNQGKGAAIRTGLSHAHGDYVIIQDADLEYDPNEYNKLLNPIINGYADVVYGSRFMGEGPHRVLFFWHTIGNKWLTMLSNMFSNLNLTDMETCYKLFKKEVISQVSISENRFGMEPEITLKIARIPNIRIYEVGISYYGRTYAEGKKINYKDGFRAIVCILKYGLFRMK